MPGAEEDEVDAVRHALDVVLFNLPREGGGGGKRTEGGREGGTEEKEGGRESEK